MFLKCSSVPQDCFLFFSNSADLNKNALWFLYRSTLLSQVQMNGESTLSYPKFDISKI